MTERYRNFRRTDLNFPKKKTKQVENSKNRFLNSLLGLKNDLKQNKKGTLENLPFLKYKSKKKKKGIRSCRFN